jgi:hypothetical protein
LVPRSYPQAFSAIAMSCAVVTPASAAFAAASADASAAALPAAAHAAHPAASAAAAADPHRAALDAAAAASAQSLAHATRCGKEMLGNSHSEVTLTDPVVHCFNPSVLGLLSSSSTNMRGLLMFACIGFNRTASNGCA